MAVAILTEGSEETSMIILFAGVESHGQYLCHENSRLAPEEKWGILYSYKTLSDRKLEITKAVNKLAGGRREHRTATEGRCRKWRRARGPAAVDLIEI